MSASRRNDNDSCYTMLASFGSNSCSVYAFNGLFLNSFINSWSSGKSRLSRSSLSFSIPYL